MIYDLIVNAIRGFMIWVQHMIFTGLVWVIQNFMTSNISFDMSSFKDALGGSEMYDSIRHIFVIAGSLIIVFLLIYHGIISTFGNVIEVKDSAVGIIAKSIFAAALIVILGPVTDKIGSYATDVETIVFEKFDDATSTESSDSSDSDLPGWTSSLKDKEIDEKDFDTVDQAVEDNDSDKADDAEYSDATKEAVANAYAKGSSDDEAENEKKDALLFLALGFSQITAVILLLKVLINIVMWLIIAYHMLKLAINLIRRYVVFCVLNLTSPLFASMGCSAETQPILVTFMKMYGTQIGMIILSKLWIQLTLLMLSKVYLSIFGFFMIVAFINIGVSMENMARDLGFSVASQGGALLDSVVATGFVLGNAYVMGKHGIGKAAIDIGSANNNASMVKFGMNAMGAKGGLAASPENIAKTMADNRFAGKLASQKGMPTSSQIANLGKILDRGGMVKNQALGQALSNLSGEGRKQALNALMEQNYGNLIGKMGEKGLQVTASGEVSQMRGIGVQITDPYSGKTRSGYLSSEMGRNGKGLEFTSNSGQEAYLNFDNAKSLNSANGPLDIDSGLSPLGKSGEMYDPSSLSSGEIMTDRKFDPAFLVDGDMDTGHYFSQATESGAIEWYHGDNPDDTSAQLCGYQDSRKAFGMPQSGIADNDQQVLQSFNTSGGAFYNLGVSAENVEQKTNTLGQSVWHIEGHDSRGRDIEMNLAPSLSSTSEAAGDKSAYGWTVFDVKSPEQNKKKRKNTK